MSHSETQEITGNHITREQQLQNMRLATQKYLQPENQVNTQSILPENTGHTEQAAVQPEILWYKNESNYVPEQPVYNGSSEKYEAKAAQFHAPVSETYKIPEKPDRQVAREQQLKSIRLATQKYVRNAQNILKAAGTDLAHVVKTTVYLDSMDDFAAMNEVYAEFFSQPFPARSAVAIEKLPKGALVEVEVLAAK